MSQGHHGAAVSSSEHADQSASRNMAYQTEQQEKELGRRLAGLSDPRLILGGAIVFFGILLILPFALDYIQDLILADGRPIVQREDSKGPSSTSLAIICGTMSGGGFNLQKKVMDGYKKHRVESNRALKEEEPGQARAGAKAAGGQAYLRPEGMRDLVSASSKETVEQMCQASGLARQDSSAGAGLSRSQFTPAAFASFGAPMQTAPVFQEYGGAVQSASGDHMVFIPGQEQIAPADFNSSANAGAALATYNAQEQGQFRESDGALSTPLSLRRESQRGRTSMLEPSAGSPACNGQKFRVFVNR